MVGGTLNGVDDSIKAPAKRNIVSWCEVTYLETVFVYYMQIKKLSILNLRNKYRLG